jgi:hypothetical protein
MQKGLIWCSMFVTIRIVVFVMLTILIFVIVIIPASHKTFSVLLTLDFSAGALTALDL